MNEFSGSIHIKKKEKKRIEKEYVEFSARHAVPPLIAFILMTIAVGVVGGISWQLWLLHIPSLQFFTLVVWYLILFLGVILWRALYHRRIELYPAKIVVYDIFMKSELVLTNIIGYHYVNENTVLLKHRSDKGATKLHLDVDGRQHLEQWLQEGFLNLDTLNEL